MELGVGGWALGLAAAAAFYTARTCQGPSRDVACMYDAPEERPISFFRIEKRRKQNRRDADSKKGLRDGGRFVPICWTPSTHYHIVI
jgi:hypothetical protein